MSQKNLEVYINESQTCGTDDCFWLPNMRAPRPWIHTCMYTYKQTNKHTWILTYIHEHMSQKVSEHVHKWFTNDSQTCCTEWRRLIGSPKLHIIFHKRATKYTSLSRKMTYKDKGSYESSPPCTEIFLQRSLFDCQIYERRGYTYIHMCILTYIHTYIHTYTHTCIHTYPTCIHAYMHTYMHTFIHTYIHSYIHTYVHIYVHTYIHTGKDR